MGRPEALEHAEVNAEGADRARAAGKIAFTGIKDRGSNEICVKVVGCVDNRTLHGLRGLENHEAVNYRAGGNVGVWASTPKTWICSGRC